MNKLFWTISLFFLLSNGIFANNIFDNYPWLTGLVQQGNCSTEKIEVYQTGIFTYLLPATIQENQQLRIFNAFGEMVLERTVAPSDHTSEIEVGDFQNGLYYLVLFTEGKEQVQKFIKQDLR